MVPLHMVASISVHQIGRVHACHISCVFFVCFVFFCFVGFFLGGEVIYLDLGSFNAKICLV